MSNIHLTGIDKVQQMNCAKGQASTTSAINNIDNSTDVLILLMKEPWITSTGQPPHSKNYDMLLPTNNYPKCPTYVRKQIGLRRFIHKKDSDSILSTIIHINHRPMEITNVYTPTKSEVTPFLVNHIPLPNAYIAEDINAHHPSWYAEDTESRNDSIRNSAKTSTVIILWMDHFGFSLLNQLGVFTHFPKIDKRSSIIHLTFASGLATTLVQGWHCNNGTGGDFDYTLTEKMWNINPRSYVPRPLHFKCDWAQFEKTLSALEGRASDWSSSASTLLVADRLMVQICIATDKAIPWSKPRKASRQWWTPEITALKKRLAHTQRLNRGFTHTADTKEVNTVTGFIYRFSIVS